MDDELRPIAAFVASLIAGILILVGGAFLSVAGSVATGLGYGQAGSLLGALGAIGFLLGLLIVILAILLFRDPDAHVGYGVGILVVSLFALVGGGGFLIGTVIGVIGGILAIVFEPEEGELPPPLASTVPSQAAPAGARCPNCGAPVSASVAKCPSCEIPLHRGIG